MKRILLTTLCMAATLLFAVSCNKDNDLPDNREDVPKDVISGMFSINENGDKVFFSKGNLYCIRSGSEGAYSYKFEFEDKQWQYHTRYGKTHFGPDNEPVPDPASLPGIQYKKNESGLFQWVSENAAEATDDIRACLGAFSDLDIDGCEGKADDVMDFSDAMGEHWSALSEAEICYIFEERDNAIALFRNNVTVNGVLGIVIAPDDWDIVKYPVAGEGSITSYDETTSPKWSVLESLGLVFLPDAGYLSEENVYSVNSSCFYNARTAHKPESVYGLGIGELGAGLEADYRAIGHSFRLVYR